MLRLDNVTLTAGTKELLREASLHVHPSDKIGIVGPNGSGKTTLLRLLLGEVEPEAGDRLLQGGVEIGYLQQQAVSGSTRSVWDEAASQMHRINRLQRELERVEAKVAEGDEAAIERLEEVSHAFKLAGGYAKDEKIGEVLHGLGFPKASWTRPCDTFSGGWQMRIALARLLLSDANLLLLDEPTNHLDLHARSWLAYYLERLAATVVLVSHDRFLLDKVCKRTVEVRHKGLMVFKGNYSAWLTEKELRDVQQQQAYDRQQEDVAKLERFVERFKAKATKAAQARSRQKQLDRMERIDAPVREFKPRLHLHEAPPSTNIVYQVKELAGGWSPESEPVFSNVELQLERGQRLAILGPNGCGKSTFMKTLAGRIPALGGRRKEGVGVLTGVFTQDLAAELPMSLSGLEYIQGLAPTVPPAKIRAALGALGLRGDAGLREISQLSGGEKARVVLAGFAVQPHNVLLLDEPTNHLDAESIDELVRALKAFEGAVMFITHDRYLVEQVATHVGHLTKGGLSVHEGVRRSDLEATAAGKATSDQGASDPNKETRKASHEDRKAMRKERTKRQRRFDRLETLCGELEEKMEAIEASLEQVGTDYQRAAELSEDRDRVEQELEAAFEEMSELEVWLDEN